MAVIILLTTLLVFELEQNHFFGDWGKGGYWLGQLAIGIVYGGLAIMASEYGEDIGWAKMNIRDTAPLCAGLLFGGPSGILAGVIGGVYRYLWGVGDYTRLACTLAVALSGVIAAVLRRAMFDGKRGPWIYGFGIGGVCEVLHMLLIIMTNAADLTFAFHFIDRCAVPMILGVSLTTMFSCLIISAAGGKRAVSLHRKAKQRRELSRSFQFWLLLCVVIAFGMTCLFSFSVQSGIAVREAEHVLKLNLEDLQEEVEQSPGGLQEALGYASAWRVGQSGGILVVDQNMVIQNGSEAGKRLREADAFQDYTVHEVDSCFIIKVYGIDSYCMFTKHGSNYYIGYIPVEEVMFYRTVSLYVTVFTEILIFAALFILIYILTKKLVVDNLRRVNRSLAEITGGNLEEQVNVRDYAEFASLSDDINSTVGTLKHYITEAAARIDKELEFARTIQHSSLPSVFPPYPDRKDFDIFARMDAAKEVGGDFYDFYLCDTDYLYFLIADVSGKGIPAAMFMMKAKSIIKGLAETGIPIEEVFTRANQELCENNEAGMFVTAWLGRLDTRTGEVVYVNAGHNPPLVKQSNGEFTYLKCRPGFVLAGLDTIRYRSGSFQMQPGDMIYLYTDGVTEATNAEEELYGEERLCRFLNGIEPSQGQSQEAAIPMAMESLCAAVKSDVDRFVGDAPQFDDITMLALRWKGESAR